VGSFNGLVSGGGRAGQSADNAKCFRQPTLSDQAASTTGGSGKAERLADAARLSALLVSLGHRGGWVANENRPTWFPQWYALRGARAGPGTRTPKRRSMHLDAKANAAAVHPIPSGSRGDSRSSTAHDAWSKALSRSFFGYAPPMGEIHRKRSDAGQRGPWSQGFTAVAARSPRAAICPRGTRISPLYVVSTIVLNLHFP
jgi:hypothetical protein